MKKLLVAMVIGAVMAGSVWAQENDLQKQQLQLQQEQNKILQKQLETQKEQLRLQEKQERNERMRMWGLSLENEPIRPTRQKEEQ